MGALSYYKLQKFGCKVKDILFQKSKSQINIKDIENLLLSDLEILNDEENELKVVRGGSWKDVKYFLQVSSRDYENADQARSYFVFRTVHDYLGADLTDNAMTNASIRKQNNRRSSIK